VYAFLADHRHQLFPPELFADVTRHGGGHPSVPAEVVAAVMVLQALEGLSDREAISALRRDIAWKVACGLGLDDEGFHPTVLVYWRARLRCSDRPRRIFEAVRQVVEATGVLAGRGRRVLDSTILEDAVVTQDTVTQLVAAIRRVRRLVPQARAVRLTAHGTVASGRRASAASNNVEALLPRELQQALKAINPECRRPRLGALVEDTDGGDRQMQQCPFIPSLVPRPRLAPGRRARSRSRRSRRASHR
jgi:hypothetical protein